MARMGEVPKVGLSELYERIFKGAINNFDVLKPVTEPQKFGELEQYKVEIGSGAVICMTNDILPIDEKNRYVPAWLI
jgi:hypothetical protein